MPSKRRRHEFLMSLRKLGPVCFLLIAATAAVWQLARDSGSARSSGTTGHDQISAGWLELQRAAARDRPAEGSVQALRNTYAAMRSSPEPVPTQMVARTVETLGAPPHALHFENAQYISTVHGGLWIVAGQGIACIVRAGLGTVTCGTIKSFIEHGLVINMRAGGQSPRSSLRYEVMGVAPDRAQAAEVRVGVRNTRIIPVRRNGYSFRADEIVLVKRLIY